VYEWIEMFKSSQTNVDADRRGHPSASANEQNIECVQAIILGNCWVTVAESAARLGINVAHSWCKAAVAQLV
jgi:hypothetical protein